MARSRRSAWRCAVVAMLALAVHAGAAHAQVTRDWDTTTGDWYVDTNWSPIGQPAGNDTLRLGAGADATAGFGVTLDGGSILLSNGASAAFNGNLYLDDDALVDVNHAQLVTAFFNLGNFGPTALSATHGSTLDTHEVNIGMHNGSTSTALLSGAGTTWTNTVRVTVGQFGAGTLHVDDTATLTTSELYVGNTVNGILQITGGSTVSTDTLFMSGNTDTSELLVDASTFNVAGNAYFGTDGLADAVFRNGAQVATGITQLGYLAGEYGTIRVTGENTVWAASEIYVQESNSVLEVEAGGRLDVASDLTMAQGTLRIDGGTINTHRIHMDSGVTIEFPRGELNVTDRFTSNSIFTLDGDAPTVNLDGVSNSGVNGLTIGKHAAGTLNLANGSFFQVLGGVMIGENNGSNGNLSLQDSGANLAFTTVGQNGVGTLTARNASIQVMELSIGNGATGSGTVQLDDATLQNTGFTFVGNRGSLHILNGSTVISQGGLFISSTGLVEIDGGTLQLYADFNSAALDSSGTILVRNGGRLQHSSGTSTVGSGLTLESGGILEGNGVIEGIIDARAGSTIRTFSDTFTVGDATSFQGFRTHGELEVYGGRLELQSKGLAYLGLVNTLTNGTLAADNGVTLDVGRVITGSGAVEGRIAAAVGSIIDATGDLALGDADSFAGFFSDGELYTGTHTVTLHDRDRAVLGALNVLGDNSAGGTLTAANGMLLQEGRTLEGHGDVNGAFRNQGHVHGEGPAAGQGIAFHSLVTGSGAFTGDVAFAGGYAPGNSPAAISLENARFTDSNTLTLELGGLTPGSQHDQLNLLGLLQVDGSLEVTLINGFNPVHGDSFDLLNFALVQGQFQSLILPLLDPGLSWHTGDLYTTGTLAVIPEPGSVAMLLPGLLLLLRRRTLRR